MRKEIEINGCVEIPDELTMDAFADAFKVDIWAVELTKLLTDII